MPSYIASSRPESSSRSHRSSRESRHSPSSSGSSVRHSPSQSTRSRSVPRSSYGGAYTQGGYGGSAYTYGNQGYGQTHGQPQVVFAYGDSGHRRNHSTGGAYPYAAPASGSHSQQVQYIYPSTHTGRHDQGYRNHRDFRVSDSGRRTRSSSPTFGERLKWLFGMGHKQYHDSGKRTKGMRDSARQHDESGRHIYAV